MAFALITSCVSTKSTLKNVDNSLPRPKIEKSRIMNMEMSSDKKYGYNKDYPINIGFDPEKLAERNIGYYFNSLEGENSEKFTYVKIQDCCPFPTTRNAMGVGTLAIYEITLEQSQKKVSLYFNIFDKGILSCPVGFLIKK